MKGARGMARPSKAVSLMSKHLTNSERTERLENEVKLKGDADEIKPLPYLSPAQKKIFRFIVKNLESSGILGNLDNYVLSECAVCIDRMQTIEMQINSDPGLLLDRSLLSAKDKYTKAFFRYCNELSLSPQSRAKLANIGTQKEESPLKILLMGEDDD